MIELIRGRKYWLGTGQAEEKFFIEVCKGLKDYVEIGTMHGGSACAAGSVMTGDIYCIDPFYKCPADDVRANWVHNGLDPARLHVFQQEHPPWPEELKKKKFDVGYIDGNHEYEYVSRDWEEIKKHCKVVLFHDVWVKPIRQNYKFMQGAEVAPSQVFNRILEEDPHWELIGSAYRLGAIRRK